MKIFKIVIHTAFLLSILVFFSCEGDLLETVDCSECYQTEPDTGDIKVDITINDQNPSIPLIIYKGDIDNNNIEYIDTAFSSPYYLDVPIGKYYSVKAKYKVNEKTIIAIDGDKIKTKKVTDSCDEDCYIIKGGDIDARLKYD